MDVAHAGRSAVLSDLCAEVDQPLGVVTAPPLPGRVLQVPSRPPGKLGAEGPETIDWEAEFEFRYREVFERELAPVEGVVEALRVIGESCCVASSGTHAKIRCSLGLTGLMDYFGNRIFSVEDVTRGKPEPDLFLHAAKEPGVAPKACAVIEDSPAGIPAALAAGMGAFAFAGGLIPVERLRGEGVVVFDDMRLLPGLLGWVDDHRA